MAQIIASLVAKVSLCQHCLYCNMHSDCYYSSTGRSGTRKTLSNTREREKLCQNRGYPSNIDGNRKTLSNTGDIHQTHFLSHTHGNENNFIKHTGARESVYVHQWLFFYVARKFATSGIFLYSIKRSLLRKLYMCCCVYYSWCKYITYIYTN